MKSVVFNFYGGALNGQTIEGRFDPSGSCDSALKWWIDSGFGTVGRHFHIYQDECPPADDLYVVTSRAENYDRLHLRAEYRPDPRD